MNDVINPEQMKQPSISSYAGLMIFYAYKRSSFTENEAKRCFLFEYVNEFPVSWGGENI